MENIKEGPHGEYCGCDQNGVYVGMGCPNPNCPLEVKSQTAVDWLFMMLHTLGTSSDVNNKKMLQRAKEMEKERMVKFAEFVSLAYPSKNRNFKGEMLHARSKYDPSERTIDLLEIFYKRYYGNQTT